MKWLKLLIEDIHGNVKLHFVRSRNEHTPIVRNDYWKQETDDTLYQFITRRRIHSLRQLTYERKIRANNLIDSLFKRKTDNYNTLASDYLKRKMGQWQILTKQYRHGTNASTQGKQDNSKRDPVLQYHYEADSTRIQVATFSNGFPNTRKHGRVHKPLQ